jgi:hypothetical protein
MTTAESAAQSSADGVEAETSFNGGELAHLPRAAASGATVDTWRFRLFGVSYFITTFAPFYGMGHPRHSPLSGSSFLFFQPEVSFDHHGITASNPKRLVTKQTIRENFAAHGCPYPDDLVRQPIEALKYIKPLDPRGKPVFWWYPRLDVDKANWTADGGGDRA